MEKANDEPKLLACTPWDDHGEADDAALNVETIRARDAGVEQATVKVDEGESTELTVEQLLALAELGGEPADGVPNGADAWERVVGSTVKRVEGKERKARPGRKETLTLIAKEEDVQEPSPRKLKLEQEMSETREMVRTLSARVSRVEARIGEMERIAGQLEVRRRKLAESEGENRARWIASLMGAFSWKRYLFYLGLGACAFLLREAVRRRH